MESTRSNLLEMKKKITLAKKGHSLLKKKQDFLISEFLKTVRIYKESRKDLLGKTRVVFKSLSLDIAYSGIFISRSVSQAAPKNFELEHDEENIMGVKIPKLDVKTLPTESNTYENAPQLVEVKLQFQELLADLIRVTSLEMKIKTLGEEIKKVKRRVNSLENVQIPEMESVRDNIIFVLGEQERENFTRLKIIKNRISAEE